MKKFNYLGPVLIFLHSSLAILIILIILFSNDILNLLILLFILKLILFANYQCNDCPISTIEDNYNNLSSMDIWGIFTFKNYSKKNRSQNTLTIIYIAILLTLIKICGLLLFKSIKKK